MSSATPMRDDITPVLEFTRARLGEQWMTTREDGDATALRAIEWMQSLADRYRAIVSYADAPYRDAEMTPETTARREGYLHALSVAIREMAEIWDGHPGKPVYDHGTGVYTVPSPLT